LHEFNVKVTPPHLRKVIEMKRNRPTRLHASAKIKRQQAELLTLGSKALGL
jgi:hypothetical protein